MKRSILAIVVAVVAASAFASNVPLHLAKNGNCQALVTLTDRESGRKLASCGTSCSALTIDVPAGTWVTVSPRNLGGCSDASVLVDGSMVDLHRASGEIRAQIRSAWDPAGT